MFEQPPPELTQQLVGRWGVPAGLLAIAYYVAPKIWAWMQSKFSIGQQQTELTQAGLGSINEVINNLRQQITDLSTSYAAASAKLKEMSATLEQAVQDAAKAKSDLYAAQLWIERLQAQVRSTGNVPVDRV